MGLRRLLVEHNCPPLPEKVAAELNGGYTGVEPIRDAVRQERNIKDLMKRLKEILDDEHKEPTERQEFMDLALKRQWQTEDEAEAVRRVYLELYGKMEVSV